MKWVWKCIIVNLEPVLRNEPVNNQYGYVGNHEDDISYNEIPMQPVVALPGKQMTCLLFYNDKLSTYIEIILWIYWYTLNKNNNLIYGNANYT